MGFRAISANLKQCSLWLLNNGYVSAEVHTLLNVSAQFAAVVHQPCGAEPCHPTPITLSKADRVWGRISASTGCAELKPVTDASVSERTG
jgi:hypothetical protein